MDLSWRRGHWRSQDARRNSCHCLSSRYARCSPQLVAIDDRARITRNVIEYAALDERVRTRVAEQDQRRPIVVTTRVAGDLPALRKQLFDGERRRLGGPGAERRKDERDGEAQPHAGPP